MVPGFESLSLRQPPALGPSLLSGFRLRAPVRRGGLTPANRPKIPRPAKPGRHGHRHCGRSPRLPRSHCQNRGDVGHYSRTGFPHRFRSHVRRHCESHKQESSSSTDAPWTLWTLWTDFFSTLYSQFQWPVVSGQQHPAFSTMRVEMWLMIHRKQ